MYALYAHIVLIPMDTPALRFLTWLSCSICEINPSNTQMLPMNNLKNLWNSWKKRGFFFLPNVKTITFKSFQTCTILVICRQIRQTMHKAIRSHSVGVKSFECDISDKNENAPTECRGIFEAFGFYRDVVIPIVAKSIINFNSYARLYV